MITEWWQQLIISLVTISFGALIGYCFSRRGAGEERKLRDVERLRSAVSGILVEVEANLNIAIQPFEGRLVPFLINIWEVSKGEFLGLPENVKHSLYEAYVEIQMTNALVQTDLHKVTLGRGYYDEQYQEKCKKVAQKTEEAIELIRDWLKIKVKGNKKGRSPFKNYLPSPLTKGRGIKGEGF